MHARDLNPQTRLALEAAGHSLGAVKGRRRDQSEAEDLFDFQCRAFQLPVYHRQFRFAREIGREWRADFAFLEAKLLVEIDGGIWTRGAHGHPLDITRNMEKRNDATLLGWWLVSFPTHEIKSGEPIAFVQRVLAKLTHGKRP